MSFSLILLSLISSAHAFDIGYYNSTNLPANHRPANLERALKASVHLQIGENGSCSASIISSDGYVLTAGHCISECLMAHEAATKDEGEEASYSLYSYARQNGSITCGDLSIREFGSASPTVVYAGRGYAEFDDRKIMNLPAVLFQKMLGTQDDFAILKFPTRNSKPCIPVAANPNLQTGDALWAIGFPGSNYRPGRIGSDGYSEYISYGTVYSDITRNQYYQENHFSSQMFARAGQFYGLPNWVISNMDTYPGDSGALVMNQNGELVGVHVAGAIPTAEANQRRFIDGASVTTRLSSILAEVRQNLGDAKTAEIFKCTNP